MSDAAEGDPIKADPVEGGPVQGAETGDSVKRDPVQGDEWGDAVWGDAVKDAEGPDPVNETLEPTARRIAQRGRDELVTRLRPAFDQAAAAHGDLLELGPEQLESMVQHAADHADGLQWRRALAAVASEELEIGLGEALGHPAVARAQTIVGAPSYEESLAQLTAARKTGAPRGPLAPVAAGKDRPPGAGEPAGRPQAAGGTEKAEGPVSPAETQGRKAEREDQAVERRARIAERQQRIAERQQPIAERQQPIAHRPPPDEEVAGQGDPASSTSFPRLRLPAIHLGGIAKLAPGEADIVLRFSEEGLDIVRRSSAAALGRLGWSDISELEIPAARGRLRRRRRQGAELVIRAGQGDANFEIPNLTPDQLRTRLTPALARLNR